MHLERVRELVRTVLEQSPEFDGRADLVGQVSSINVADGPVSRVDLVVRKDCPPAQFGNGPVPGSCWAWAEDGSPIGTVQVWVEDGYVRTLELGWVTDDPPTELPPGNRLTTDTMTPPDTTAS